MFSKSPSFARKGHQQLTGSDADEKDRIIAGIQVCVRYVGSTEVASVNGTGSGKTEIPVARVFEQHKKKSDGRMLKKMIMTICSKSLSVSEEGSGKLVAHFPIAKITFCNIDGFYEKAFVFIARDKAESPFKAFIFSCESKAKAREAFKALSLAFTINFESYQASLVRGPNAITNTKASDETNSVVTRPELKAGHGPRSQQQQQNGLDPLLKGTFVFHRSGPSSLAQHRRLAGIQAIDSRGRSTSNPPYGTEKSVPAFLSHPSLNIPTSSPSVIGSVAKNCDDTEDAEFTEFAELRLKSRSSTTLDLASSHHGIFVQRLQRYDSAPNIWRAFQNPCPPIH